MMGNQIYPSLLHSRIPCRCRNIGSILLLIARTANKEHTRAVKRLKIKLSVIASKMTVVRI
jgi:hypothetical protein